MKGNWLVHTLFASAEIETAEFHINLGYGTILSVFSYYLQKKKSFHPVLQLEGNLFFKGSW